MGNAGEVKDVEKVKDVKETKDLKEKNIYQKLSYIQTKLNAPKSRHNKFGNYNYRNCEDILSALKPLLEETETFVLLNDELITMAETVFINNAPFDKKVIYLQSTAKLIDGKAGASIESKALAEKHFKANGMNESQVTGSISSYARRYALNALFAIDDMDTIDDDERPRKDKAKDPHKFQSIKGEGKSLSDKQIQRLHAIATSVGVEKEKLNKIIIRDYKKESSKDLTKKEYDELIERLENLKEKAVANE